MRPFMAPQEILCGIEAKDVALLDPACRDAFGILNNFLHILLALLLLLMWESSGLADASVTEGHGQ